MKKKSKECSSESHAVVFSHCFPHIQIEGLKRDQPGTGKGPIPLLYHMKS